MFYSSLHLTIQSQNFLVDTYLALANFEIEKVILAQALLFQNTTQP